MIVASSLGIHPTCRPAQRALAESQTAAPSPSTSGASRLPSLAAVHAARISTRKHVPKAARNLWAQALVRALAAVVAYNTVDAWTELEMLPKCVLVNAPRGGRKNKRASAAFTEDRLTRWLEGERMELWEARAARAPAGRGDNSESAKIRRAKSFGRDGYDSKACAMCLSTGACAESEAVAEDLRTLHPAHAPPQCSVFSSLPPAAEIDEVLVERMLRSFPADSAPGPSGLRVQHIRDALMPAYSTQVLEQLTSIAQLLAKGEAPAEVAQDLAGTALIALPKAKGWVRPIVIGELLRRLTGKCLCSVVKEDARAFFHPVQVGVACPSGVEAAIHAAREWASASAHDSTKGFIKLDFSNAFNCVSREQALSQVTERFPSLSRWAHWCYRNPSNLRFGDFVIQSTEGVQQGDPLGPLLFAAALQPLALALRNFEHGGKRLDLAAFYLDDGFLAGDLDLLGKALALVQREAEAIGLTLSIGKCELIIPAGMASSDVNEIFPPSLLFDPLAGVSRVNWSGDFELLGAPIGCSDHCEKFTMGKASGAHAIWELLPKLEDPQMALRLLRQCASICKLTHCMRGTPPELQHAALQSFDESLRSAFCTTTGLLPDHAQWDQACRSLRYGGLGLRSCSRHAAAAYVASRSGSDQLVRDLLPEQVLSSSDRIDFLSQARQEFGALLPDAGGELTDPSAPAKQKSLSEALDEASFNKHYTAAGLAERASLLSECEAGARAFWSAIPNSSLGLSVGAAEFVEEIRSRLCIQICPNDKWCPLCDAIFDTHARHARTCNAGGDRVMRHNALRNFIFRFAQQAGLSPELERPGLLIPSLPDEGKQNARRPADVYLPRWSRGSPAALDFAVTAPFKQSSLTLAAKEALAAASDYTSRKKTHLNTAESCQQLGISFLPMVVETTGAWSADATKVLGQLAAAVAAATGRHFSTLYAELLQGAAVRVRRANARAALRRASQVPGQAETAVERALEAVSA